MVHAPWSPTPQPCPVPLAPRPRPLFPSSPHSAPHPPVPSSPRHDPVVRATTIDQYGDKLISSETGGSTACPGIAPPANAATYYSGNPTCASIGSSTYGETWSEFKIDGMRTSKTYTIPAGGTVTISGATNTQFNWASTRTMRAVFVKASTGGNLFK